MRIAPEELSKPLSEDQPCGENLEYDPVFQRLETLMAEQGEDVVVGDDGANKGPDWKAVAEQVEDLLPRTRDMRVLVHAAMAGLNIDGIPTFHKALITLNNCLEKHWDSIHPQLDPDDDNDPIMRMNVLQNLTDYDHVRQGLRHCPLIEMKGVGSFSLRDIDVAEGRETPREGEEVVDAALIKGAFSEADPAVLEELAGAISGSLDELDRMLVIWADKTSQAEAPALEDTRDTLRDVARVVSNFSPSAAAAVEAASGGGAAAPTAEAPAAPPGAITSRNDVINAIDRICEYYNVNEPSSPIPLLLKRAKGLVSKSFMEILENIAPEGMNTARQVTGEPKD